MAKSSVTGDSNVILPYPDVCGAAVKRTTVIIARASPVLPNDWITLHGALAQTTWLCHVQLSALAATSFQKLRSV